jgi:hypothetical protein
MTVPSRERERRDWTLIIFLIPLGIILIIIVGQLAIRMFPNWVINADMRSNLDPNSAPGQPASLLQPLLPQILTPMAWAENYLTPGSGEISFPPFIVLEPTNTPTATPVSPTPTTATPTATTPSPTSTITATSTPNPTDDNTPTPSATTPSPSPTTPSPSPTTPSPTPTGYPSTPNPGYGTPAPIPSEINIGSPPDNPFGSYAGIGEIKNGTYIVINYSIVVGLTPDNNYDLVYYEYNNSGYVNMDWLIIGISNFADGSLYYEVFNWGNGIPDNNSNVGDVAGSEVNNQQVNLSELYDPDSPDLSDNSNSTGILIDVDNAPSNPPPNTYNYIVIIAPIVASGESAQVDAIVVTEIPIPTP